MRERAATPPGFSSYVDARLRLLEAAAHRLTTDEPHAERMARELLTLLALRWRRLGRADAAHELAAGTSADAYLLQLFGQEAAELGYPGAQLNLQAHVASQPRPALAGRLSATEEADLIWEAARGRVRRRLLAAGAAAAALTVVALCRRGSGDQGLAGPPPVVGSTELPTGARILGGGPFPPKTIPRVPERLDLPATEPQAITAAPLGRALLLAAATARSGLPVYAFGDDGGWRMLDNLPAGAGRGMAPGCLSPDGTCAAFNTPAGAVLLDLSTGVATPFPQVRSAADPVWLSANQVLLGEAALVDRAGGVVVKAPIGPENVVTVRGAAGGSLIELLPAGQPVTAPARVRRWSLGDGTQVTLALSGALSHLTGVWESAGFGIGDDRVARLCRPAEPALGDASWLAAVLSPKTGEVAQALLFDARSGSPTVLGWDGDRRVLLDLAKGDRHEIVGWDPVSGEVGLACTLDFAARLSLRDLTSPK